MSVTTAVTSTLATTRLPEGYVWNDKYADNHRLSVDLERAHSEIRRLGGVIPEPCGPMVFGSIKPEPEA